MTRHPLMALICAATLAATAVAQPPAANPAEEKARELFAAGKYDEALAQLREATKGDPKLAPARVQLAGMFFLAQQGAAARQNLETALAEDPRHPEALLLNANFALAEGRLTDAILSCQAALAVVAEPRAGWPPEQRVRLTREARIGLATAFEARRDYAAARDQLAEALAADPTSGPARSRLAATSFHLGRPDEAFAEFQAASKNDPALDLPESQMAALYAAKGDDAKTEEWLKKAVAAHGKLAKPHRAYAGWLVDRDKLDEAKLSLDAAAKLDPASKETLALRGLALRHRKDYAAAEPLFEGLLKDAPGNTFAALNLALVLVEAGDAAKLTKATELAEGEARKVPRNPEALAVLGWCYCKAGKLDDAEKLLAAAGQAGPMSRDTAYFAARVLADRRRYPEALKLLQEVAKAPGPHLYRAESAALLAEVAAKLPAKP